MPTACLQHECLMCASCVPHLSLICPSCVPKLSLMCPSCVLHACRSDPRARGILCRHALSLLSVVLQRSLTPLGVLRGVSCMVVAMAQEQSLLLSRVSKRTREQVNWQQVCRRDVCGG